jgi:hypothetical protein
MLVHKFYLVECIQVEFKFELNSNRFEWKQESESVILSFLSHSRSLSFLSHSLYSQSFLPFSQSFLLFSVIPYILSLSFFSQSFSFFPQLFLLSRSFPQLDPTCRPLLPPSSPALNFPPRSPASSLASGPHVSGTAAALQRAAPNPSEP